MEFDPGLFIGLFARTITLWWVILPAIFLGLVVGAIPGFSAANTIIILLPLTLAMDPEIGLVFSRAPPAPPPLRSTAIP
jgi:putative tricarboxylic transport membrane protein